MAQTLLAVAARILGYIMWRATLFFATSANERPSALFMMFQHFRRPQLALIFQHARAASVFICVAFQIRKLLGADAAHFALVLTTASHTVRLRTRSHVQIAIAIPASLWQRRHLVQHPCATYLGMNSDSVATPKLLTSSM